MGRITSYNVCYTKLLRLFSQAGALPGSALENLIEQVRALDMAEVHRQIAEEQAQGQEG